MDFQLPIDLWVENIVNYILDNFQPLLDGIAAVVDGFGAVVEGCVGSGNDGRDSEGNGSGREEPDDDEGVGSGGSKPAKAGAPVSTRARVPAATVPARRAALLGIVGLPPGRFLEIANEPLPGK